MLRTSLDNELAYLARSRRPQRTNLSDFFSFLDTTVRWRLGTRANRYSRWFLATMTKPAGGKTLSYVSSAMPVRKNLRAGQKHARRHDGYGMA